MRFFLAGTVVVGVALGVLVGLAGTGGAFIIPALVYGFGVDQLKAQGTSLLIAATPVWLIPFFPYYRAGNYDLRLGILLAVGLGIGSYFGSSWAQHLPLQLVRRSFAVILAGLALKMFFER
jgi:hypothetical protein